VQLHLNSVDFVVEVPRLLRGGRRARKHSLPNRKRLVAQTRGHQGAHFSGLVNESRCPWIAGRITGPIHSPSMVCES
jgi:hypothetical protein